MFNGVFHFGVWWTKALDFLLRNETFWNYDDNPAELPSLKSKEQPWSLWETFPHRTFSWVFQCKWKAPQGWIFKDLKKGQTEEQPTSHQPRSQETRALWCLRNNQKEIHRLLLLFIHAPRDLHGHFISQHLSPGPCAQTTALPVPLPRESLRVFLFISTPILPGQRTTFSPEQAPRQVVQGARECCLIRRNDEKWDETSLLPVSYALLEEIFWGWGKLRALRLLCEREFRAEKNFSL